MLNVMRKHAGSWMIKVVLFAIVIVFVFWGVGSFRARNASKVATVNDEIINVANYQQAYNNLIDQYRQRFGPKLDESMLEMLQVKRQVLEQLIDRTILLQEAKKLHLRVSDAEVADSIRQTPVFQNNGSFDNHRYRSVLAQFHLTPEVFEADQKNALLANKLIRIINGAAKVSQGEARQWYDWQNTSVNIDYVLIDPARYKDIQPSAEAISAFFAEHKENYRTDPMVAARYVVIDPADHKDQVKTDADEIADYYNANIDDFKTEKTVEARHILIKLPTDADAKADQAAKTKAQDIANQAKAGQDFAELAKTYSEGPTKDRGGYLGKFQRSQMVNAFADKAFSMAPGEISDPVKTQFGWHVIKVESVAEAATKTLEQSKKTIADILISRKAKGLAYDKAEQLYESAFDKEDLVKNTEKLGLVVRETGAFDRRGPDALGPDKGAFATAAFALKADEISDIQDIGGRYYLIQVIQTIPAAIPELEAVKPKVAADLTQKMQTDKAHEDAKAMAADLQAGKGFQESADRFGLTVQQTGLFTRNQTIPAIGSDPMVIESAFQLLTVGSTSSNPLKGRGGYYLLRLAHREAPAAEGFAAEEDNIKRMLQQQKQKTLFQEWLDARKADSRITIEKAYLK